ncbi:hypothetical protein BKA70DRAFT_1219752 [Coprinopsis sp. MPI-PUGE-AT-0042]|nr:hypothetical protein BKA70DRAFT_1219752 [Coprinopsis sp. MPI-PUGE-AT-0042]
MYNGVDGFQLLGSPRALHVGKKGRDRAVVEERDASDHRGDEVVERAKRAMGQMARNKRRLSRDTYYGEGLGKTIPGSAASGVEIASDLRFRLPNEPSGCPVDHSEDVETHRVTANIGIGRTTSDPFKRKVHQEYPGPYFGTLDLFLLASGSRRAWQGTNENCPGGLGGQGFGDGMQAPWFWDLGRAEATAWINAAIRGRRVVYRWPCHQRRWWAFDLTDRRGCSVTMLAAAAGFSCRVVRQRCDCPDGLEEVQGKEGKGVICGSGGGWIGKGRFLSAMEGCSTLNEGEMEGQVERRQA